MKQSQRGQFAGVAAAIDSLRGWSCVRPRPQAMEDEESALPAADAAAAKEQQAQVRGSPASASCAALQPLRRDLLLVETAGLVTHVRSDALSCPLCCAFQFEIMRRDAKERMSALLEIATTSSRVAKVVEASPAVQQQPQSGAK